MGSVYSAGAAFFTSERTRDGPGLFPVRLFRDLSAFTFLLRHDGWSPPTDVWDQGGSALSPEVCFSARHMGSIYLLSISVMGRMNLRCWGSLEIISAFSPFLAFTWSVCVAFLNTHYTGMTCYARLAARLLVGQTWTRVQMFRLHLVSIFPLCQWHK